MRYSPSLSPFSLFLSFSLTFLAFAPAPLQLKEASKGRAAMQVIVEELENDHATTRRDLDEARSMVLRQQARIFKLEEQVEAAQRVDPM